MPARLGQPGEDKQEVDPEADDRVAMRDIPTEQTPSVATDGGREEASPTDHLAPLGSGEAQLPRPEVQDGAPAQPPPPQAPRKLEDLFKGELPAVHRQHQRYSADNRAWQAAA